jgi:uncharacterized protein
MRQLALFFCVLAVFSCADPGPNLERFFLQPVKTSAYRLGLYPDANLPEVNAFWPDSSIDHIDAVGFASGGDTIRGFHCWHNANGLSGATILYFHGTADNLDISWPRVKLLYHSGYNVLAIDYRGYGTSGGTASLDNILTDAETTLQYLTGTLLVPVPSILLYGFSIGSYPACHLAAKPGTQNALGLVLEAPIGSAEIYMQDALLLPLTDRFLSHYLNNVELIRRTTLPLLWIHGKQDMTNKWDSHGLAIYDNCRSARKYPWLIEGAGHSDVPAVIGGVSYSTYSAGIANFAAGGSPY